MASSRSAGGTWCGASHDGHACGVSSSGAGSSNARARAAATGAGGASAPGRSRQARGSGSGTGCSERIRGACGHGGGGGRGGRGGQGGQRTSVRGVEVVEVGDGSVVGDAARASGGEGAPRGGLGPRDRKRGPDASVERT